MAAYRADDQSLSSTTPNLSYAAGLGNSSGLPRQPASRSDFSSEIFNDTKSREESSYATIEDVLGEFPCVSIRGMPFDASIRDIVSFFSGLKIVDIIIEIRDGRSTGNASVLFSSKLDIDYAVRRNMQSMGKRFVEISMSSRSSFYRSVSNQVKYDSR